MRAGQPVRIEADGGGIRIREEVGGGKGEQTSVSVDARFDGKDYSVTGSPFADTVAYRRVDRHYA